MTSHLELSRMYRFIAAMTTARRHGVPPMTYREFVYREQAALFPERVKRQLVDLSAYGHRRAGVEFGRGKPARGAGYLAMAVCLNPAGAWRRFRTQVLPMLAHRRRGRLGRAGRPR